MAALVVQIRPHCVPSSGRFYASGEGVGKRVVRSVPAEARAAAPERQAGPTGFDDEHTVPVADSIAR
jgi:hypothetical protein